MLVYLIIILYLFVLSFLDLYKVRINTFHLVLSFCLLVCVSGFRYSIGSDYFNYIDIYDNIDTSFYVEPLFWLLNYTVRFLGGNAQVVIFISSLITVFFVYRALLKLSDCIYVSLLYYVISFLFFESLNTVRQGLAISISFYAYSFFIKRQYKVCSLCILASILFHYSCIIALFIFAISSKRIRPAVWLFILPFSFLFGNGIMSMILSFFSNVLSLSGYASYLNHVEVRGVSSGLFQFFLNGLSFLFLSLYNRYGKEKTVYLNFFLMSVVMYNIFLSFYVALRLYFYPFIFIVILIPLTIQLFSLKSKWIFYFFITSVFVIYTVVSLNNVDYIPYKFRLPY